MTLNRPALHGLDSIDWSALTHAYGSAEDVPELLRRLAAGDEAGDEAGEDEALRRRGIESADTRSPPTMIGMDIVVPGPATGPVTKPRRDPP